jgi:hypothetical protein
LSMITIGINLIMRPNRKVFLFRQTVPYRMSVEKINWKK